mmetsp:Transcript_13499/g.15905  ORF Transcript_13499/g.15905 Transcript_13499/m.15905 type:complete len:259 (+) Transcript_13499:19-795(+)|eukprot:CAMPEP_0198262766 /NCGR_PEP_ID=MMETSP1447-20131203/11225_1 /TAXON_ID=420782 /ORGANISM="Chaetoceros dichaeta, Strain CCMP1751" /LENGTH=258 /DNA_ID=CAMNT_0043951123 /DNA_START=24 /DNA_END=800 /DNA_ORIENTATION=+
MEAKENKEACCPASAWAKIENQDDEADSYNGIDTSIGTVEVPVYFTECPTASNKAIVIFPDVFGITNRIRAIGDTLAAKGYHVMALDCYRGETVESNPNPDIKTWLAKFQYDSVSADINAGFVYLSGLGVDQDNISAIGFCWGGWAIAKSASEGVAWKCAASPHPSTKIENSIFGRDEEMMLSKVSMPFLLLPAGNDPDILKPGSEVVKKLEETGGMSVCFDAMRHGWTTRGDLSRPAVKKDVEKALTLVSDFIEKEY